MRVNWTTIVALSLVPLLASAANIRANAGLNATTNSLSGSDETASLDAESLVEEKGQGGGEDGAAGAAQRNPDTALMSKLLGSIDEQIDHVLPRDGKAGLSGGGPSGAMTPSQFANQAQFRAVSGSAGASGNAMAAGAGSASVLGNSNVNYFDLVQARLTPGQQQFRASLVNYRQNALAVERRAQGLLVGTRSELVSLVTRLKKEKAQLLGWLETQQSGALAKIDGQEKLMATIKKQMAYLQTAYNRAVAKAETYLKQLQHLEVQRRLQTTPPFNDAITKVALTEQQYLQSLTELNHWRDSALEIAKQAREGYQRREVALRELTRWIEIAKNTLDTWIHSQQSQITAKLLAGKTAVDGLKEHLEGLKHICEDATEHIKVYEAGLERLRISGKVGSLENALGAATRQQAMIEARASTINAARKEVKRQLDALSGHLAILGGPMAMPPQAPPHEWEKYLNTVPLSPEQRAALAAMAPGPLGPVVSPVEAAAAATGGNVVAAAGAVTFPGVPNFDDITNDIPDVPIPHSTVATVTSPYSFKQSASSSQQGGDAAAADAKSQGSGGEQVVDKDKA
mmetsp:Transcript_23719/g.42027  ORF Transcript_23719/g.42027 Transcript_23719/m.42027 type:complete len:571 (+) Transcript_23719:162-1874(+)